MAFEITPGELEYQAAQVLTGKTYKVFLAVTGSLNESSTITEWEAAELATSNGYAAVTGTIGSGSYNGTSGRFEAPVISGTFGPATGPGFQYSAIVVKLQGRSKPYALNLYPTLVTVAAGASKGFNLTLGVRP